MANDRIVSDKAAYDTAIGKFTNAKQSLQNAYLQMTNAVFTLDSTWNGEASEAFKAQYGELAANLQTSDGTIETAIQDIKMVAEEQFKTEDEISHSFDTLQNIPDPSLRPFGAG